MRASIVLLLALALALVLGPAGATTLYKWIDEDGVPHFSDQPHPGAEIIELEEAQTFTAPPVIEPARDREGADDGGQFSYQGFWIAAPRGGQTLWNIEGNLSVALSLTPPLQPGHRLRVFLDGELVEGLAEASMSFTVPEVYRGTHTLRATAVDAADTVIAETEPVTFYVHQTSILSPARQNR